MKKPTSFRLSEESLRILAETAKEWGTSQASVLEVLIRKEGSSTPGREGSVKT